MLDKNGNPVTVGARVWVRFVTGEAFSFAVYVRSDEVEVLT